MKLNRLIELLIDMRTEFGGSLPARIRVRRTKTKSHALNVDSVGFRKLQDVPGETDGTCIITCSLFKETDR